MNYRQLNQNERYQIYALIQTGLSSKEIGLQLKRNKSTINHEIKRCGLRSNYDPDVAQADAILKQKSSRNARTIEPGVFEHVACYLRQALSPEQVQGRLKAEGIQAPSTETIYQYVYKDKQRQGDLHTYLRCQKARRKRYGSGRERRGRIVDKVCIEQRSPIVGERSRIGDWEGDTMVGCNHQGFIVTLVERYSRYTLACQVPNKHTQPVCEAIIEMLRPHKRLCHTITFDNGLEFAQHKYVAACLDAQVYFAHPYSSWERGTNENTNGLVRQYFPKGTNLKEVTQSQVHDAVYALNHRPRKCLGYKTPHEVFYGLPLKPIKLPTDALRT